MKMPYEIPLVCQLIKSINVFFFFKFEERYHTQVNNAAPRKHESLNENLHASHGLPTYQLLVSETPEVAKTRQAIAIAHARLHDPLSIGTHTIWCQETEIKL